MCPSPTPDPRTDETLIAAINAGDDTAFETLYYRYRDWVVRLAYRCTGSEADALDVLQDTFSYLLGKFPGLTLTARMTTFLYPVVKNLSLALRRKRKPADAQPLDDLPAPAAHPVADLADLAAILSRLPVTHREVLLMRFVDDMTLPEIAQALSIPVGTVKSRLHNALTTLRADPAAREHFTP